MENKPLVSVVVCTYNRKEMLKECLESLFNQTYPKDKYEIIIVNDGSTDSTEGVLRYYKGKAPCRFRWFTQKNRGISAARNLGIENAKGEIACFTDDDCIASKYWIMNLAKGFNDEKIGGVGGKVVTYNPKTLIEKNAPKISQSDYINIWSLLIGGNMAFRKSILNEIDGFDPLFRFGADDNDICIRVKLKGYKLKYIPDAVIYFRHRTTLKDLIKQQYGYGIGCSRLGKKYPDFPLRELASFIIIKVMWNTLLLPVRVMSVDNKNNYILEGFLNVIRSITYVTGMIKGYLFEGYPKEKVIKDRLDFLALKNEIKFKSKIRRKIEGV